MKKISCFVLFCIILQLLILPCYAAKLYKEAEYNKRYCFLVGGITEYKNEDLTRVDCLTKNNAIELDFAEKWAEGVGQALYYEQMTGKKGKVVLILENPNVEIKYFERVKKLSKIYNFEAEYITPAIFKPNCP